jgi:ribosome-associated protein
MQEKFKIEGEYIELIQLLKVMGIARTGGHAKMIVNEHIVFRNGQVETRKRAKLVAGDTIQLDGIQIDLI